MSIYELELLPAPPRLLTWEQEADLLARLDELTCGDDVDLLIARHGLGPIGRGQGRGRGRNDRLTYIRCPFHEERSASFVFYAAHVSRSGRVHAHCFGCQFDADLVGLVAALRGIPRSELCEEVLAEISAPT